MKMKFVSLVVFTSIFSGGVFAINIPKSSHPVEEKDKQVATNPTPPQNPNAAGSSSK